MVKPKETVLGESLKYIRKNGTLKLQKVNDTSIYVSIIESLQDMLTNDRLAKILIKKPSYNREGVYYDVCDGNHYKNSSFFQKPHPVFSIIIFQDAVEICNPLGNRSGKHKLVNFYWTLLNIPPQLRSKLHSMKLFAMVSKPNLDKYSFYEVLKPFFEELHKLFHGVEFKINNQDIKCFGNVILCLGDTEGQHQIGGFKV